MGLGYTKVNDRVIMRLLDRIRAVFTGSKARERIPPGWQVPDEEEEEIEELLSLDII